MKTFKVLFFLFLLHPLSALVAPLDAASPSAGIAAVVNSGHVLSSELNARLHLIALTSGLQQTSPELKEQVLKMMINERLQLQEAKKFGVEVSEKEIEDAYKRIQETFHEFELRQNVPPQGFDRFLAAHHIPKTTLTDQIEATLAWQKYIQERYQSTVQISDHEVNVVLNQLEKRKAQPHLLLAEIVLAVETPAHEQQALKDASKLREQIKKGANFALVAQQFSQSPSKALGGDIGWQPLSQLDNELRTAAATLKPGELSEPIRTASGYTLLLLRERRETGGEEVAETLVTFQQALFPVPSTMPERQKGALLQQISALSKNARSCVMFEKLAKGIPSARLKTFTEKPLNEITPLSLRDILARLSEGQVSEPIGTEAGVLLFAVCHKQKQSEREVIINHLINEKLALIAQRELRDLQRVAFIDIRE